MTKILVTGGSGFIGAHVVRTLLARGHDVVTTVRSPAKGDFIVKTNPDKKISYVIVKDIAADGAFDDAVQAQPPFDAVVHTASPFHYKVEDNRKDLLDPAINGTESILSAIKRHAPSVGRVVITSSFAAMFQVDAKVYNEETWNPVTWEEALAERNGGAVYRASKKFAETAAWDFVKEERPTFDVVALNPPLVYGPIIHDVKSLEDLNTSNDRILQFMRGAAPSMNRGYVDVRDLAEAHARALEVPEAGGQRWLIAAGLVDDQDIVDALRSGVPEIKDRFCQEEKRFDAPFEIDNSKSREILGLKYRNYDVCAVDLAKQLLQLSRP